MAKKNDREMSEIFYHRHVPKKEMYAPACEFLYQKTKLYICTTSFWGWLGNLCLIRREQRETARKQRRRRLFVQGNMFECSLETKNLGPTRATQLHTYVRKVLRASPYYLRRTHVEVPVLVENTFGGGTESRLIPGLLSHRQLRLFGRNRYFLSHFLFCVHAKILRREGLISHEWERVKLVGNVTLHGHTKFVCNWFNKRVCAITDKFCVPM